MFRKWENTNLTLEDVENGYFKDTEKLFNTLENEILNFNEYKIKQREINTVGEIQKIYSPLTLLNGKWGSGKTYFLENFINNFDKHKSNSEKKIITSLFYIDALELIEDENIIVDFLFELFKIGKGFKNYTKKTLKKTGKFGINFLIDLINYVPGFDFEKNSLEEFNKTEEIIKENKKTTPIEYDGKYTIIIIDNLERIGKDSKKILQILYKLRSIYGLIFMVVANVKKIEGNEHSKNDEEYPIYKFVNIKTFDFKQNYKPLINSMKGTTIISNQEIEIINNSLNSQESFEQLSIRELENWFRFVNYFEIENEIDRILKLNELEENFDISKQFIAAYKNDLEKISNEFLEIQNLSKGIIDDLSEIYFDFDEGLYTKDSEDFLRPISDGRSYVNYNLEKIPSYSYYGENRPENRYRHAGKIQNLEAVKKIALKASKHVKYHKDFKDAGLDNELIELINIEKSIINYKDLVNNNRDLNDSILIMKKLIFSLLKNNEKTEIKLIKEKNNLQEKLNSESEIQKTLKEIKESQDEYLKLKESLEKSENELKLIPKIELEARKPILIIINDLKSSINEWESKNKFDQNNDKRNDELNLIIKEYKEKMNKLNSDLNRIIKFREEFNGEKLLEKLNTVSDKFVKFFNDNKSQFINNLNAELNINEYKAEKDKFITKYAFSILNK